MALVFHDGFESGNGAAWESTSGSAAVSTSNPQTGTYSLRVNPTASIAAYFIVARNSLKFTLSIYIATLPNADAGLGLTNENTSLCLVLTSGGYLKLYDTSTLRGTSSAVVISNGQRKRISGAIDTTNGKAYIFVDGVVVGGLDGVTIGSSVTYWGGLGAFYAGLVAVTGTITADVYLDDIVLDGASGTTDLGDIRCAAVALPNAEGTEIEFDTLAPTTPTTHYTKYDDPAGSINDTDYVMHAAKTVVQDYANLNSCAEIGLVASDVIDAVNVCSRMKLSKTGDTVSSLAVRDNGTVYATAMTDSASFIWVKKYYATMPNGGAAWTQTRFDAFQAGAQSSGVAPDTYLSAVMVFVAYHAARGPTTYEMGLADGLKAGDIATPNATFGMEIVDGLKGGDAPVGAAAFQQILAEGMLLADAHSSIYKFPVDLAEGMKLADTPVNEIIFQAVMADGLKLGDIPSTEVNLQAILSEGLKIADAPTFEAIFQTIITDGFTLGDLNDIVRAFEMVLSEGLKVSDDAAMQTVLQLIIAEGLKTGDIVTAELVAQMTASEGIKIGDSPALQAIFPMLLAEGLTLAEVIAIAQTYEVALHDGLILGDSPSMQAILDMVASDVIRLADGSIFRKAIIIPGVVYMPNRSLNLAMNKRSLTATMNSRSRIVNLNSRSLVASFNSRELALVKK